MTVLDGLDAVRAGVGRHLGWSGWMEVTPTQVQLFAAATGDPAATYLTLALSNLFLPQIVEVRGVSLGVNYGMDRVRFPAPVAAGARLRGGAELVAAVDIAGGVQTTMRITIELDGSPNPACVIDSLSRYQA